ncbi:hypothetical protein NDU88_001358 [Pleurodeles waltl]|uniref:Uncharacterized protein n=1 Tax=Pleurodeles waltl TaxID=8319 RepID=A0AAV7Q6V5_PLEWA|nr:hypothetical protein NDU88_001358 [Pleurodeles waltl]
MLRRVWTGRRQSPRPQRPCGGGRLVRPQQPIWRQRTVSAVVVRTLVGDTHKAEEPGEPCALGSVRRRTRIGPLVKAPGGDLKGGGGTRLPPEFAARRSPLISRPLPQGFPLGVPSLVGGRRLTAQRGGACRPVRSTSVIGARSGLSEPARTGATERGA